MDRPRAPRSTLSTSPRLRRTPMLATAVVLLAAVVAACGSGGATAPATSATPSSASAATSGASEQASPTPSATPSPAAPTPVPQPLSITSTAFPEGATIPAEYTCRGRNVSPALAWTGVPTGAASLVLVVDDPDAHDFLHWSVLDLPPTATSLPRGVSASAATPQQGTNDFGAVGYGGPCPPSGTHHYRFTLYALAGPVDLPGHPDARTLRSALSTTTILAKATLTGIVAA